MSIDKNCKYCVKVLACKDYNKSNCLIQDQKDFELDEELFEKYIRQDERNKIVDILDMDLEEAKKVLVEKLKSTDKEQLYKDLVSSRLLIEKEK